MFGAVLFAVLVAAQVNPSQQHTLQNATCQLRFLKSLNEALNIKQECGGVMFTDCREVRMHVFIAISVCIPLYEMAAV